LFTTVTELRVVVFGHPIKPTRVPVDLRIYTMKPIIPTSPIAVTIHSNS
jgi:hypothetical protein